MAELTFIYNQIPTVVQCSEKDIFKVAVDKFANKAQVNPSNLYFLNNGTVKIDLNQKIEVIFHNEIQNKSKIQILTYLTEEENQNNNFNVSKDIICPKCNLPCLFEIKNYKMTFFRCKNDHTEKEVSMSNFKNSQLIDESKITCELCKNQNKSKTFQNQFYRCLTCKKNFCPLCKSSHNEEHDLIEFEQYNYVCLNHNEKFNSFCKKCKINLCMECESEHKDKENLIYFRDILPNKNKIKENLNELKTKIEQYKEKINEIKKMFDTIAINLDNYYEINDNLLKDLDKKKKNYYLFCNINMLEKNNTCVIKDINNIIKNDEFTELMNNSMELMHKMNVNYKGKKIIPIDENIENKKKEKIIGESCFHDINEYDNQSNIKKLYENFIKDENANSSDSDGLNNKFLYTALLADQCNFYEDMFYFMKAFIKNKKDILTPEERNTFAIACKQYISKNRSANRTILQYEKKEKNNSSHLNYIVEYKKIAENILYEKYQGIINFINNNIVEKNNFGNYDVEGKVYFYKMIGDYYRYLCEVDTFKSKYINKAEKYFDEALKIASKLQIYNINKLGLILNLGVFYYENLKNEKKAVELAKSAIKQFEEEAKELDKNAEENKEIFLTYDILKENLDLWEGKDKK